MAYRPKAEDIDRAFREAMPAVRRSILDEMTRTSALYEAFSRRARFERKRAGFRIVCEPPRRFGGGKSITVPLHFEPKQAFVSVALAIEVTKA